MSNSYFIWDENFNTGNELVDSQHFNLVSMINDLLSLSVNNNSIELDTIINISNKLSDYVVVHFKTEEGIMKKYSVDQRHVNDHIEAHKDFVRNVTNMFSSPEELLNTDRLNEVVEYLIRWLAYHILNTDKSLIKQINYITEKNMTPLDAYDKEEKISEASTEPLLKALKVLYLLVSNKNKEIEQKNIELEEKVKLRTAELSEANEKLQKMLFQDVLTGLPNRRFVMEEIQKLQYNWDRYQVPFSILFIDVDKFKSVNDNYGHENGDYVLKWIADFLKDNIRKTDIACRLGGDEFVVICTNTNQDGAMAIGNKLNSLCKNSSEHQLEFWKPSLSIGVSTINESIKSSSDLLKKADDAMYVSKTNGGNITSCSQNQKFN